MECGDLYDQMGGGCLNIGYCCMISSARPGIHPAEKERGKERTGKLGPHITRQIQGEM